MALAPIRFAAPSDPDVSLVLVVHGRLDLAERTLRSLARCRGAGFETFVVDNASPGDVGARLEAAVQGAEVIRSDRNLGYGTAVDLAATRARGRYIGALNSDLDFRPDWLDHLVAALDADPLAAVAGPMLLDPGGRVQEAGVIFGPDGTGYGYGDRLGPADPEVSFRRYVDYVSGAAMLVRRDVFDAVGGFDPVYGTGYYEDADLCFSARELGFRTTFQPRSKVTHLGQGSFADEHRRRQIASNRPVFVTRFEGQLEGRPSVTRPPFDPHRDLILRDWWCPTRTLVIGPDAGLCSLIQDRLPDGRVTAVGAPAGGDDRIERPVVARAAMASFLERRRFHYSDIVVAEPPGPDLGTALARSQPQARVHPDAEAFGHPAAAHRLVEALAGGGRT